MNSLHDPLKAQSSWCSETAFCAPTPARWTLNAALYAPDAAGRSCSENTPSFDKFVKVRRYLKLVRRVLKKWSEEQGNECSSYYNKTVVGSYSVSRARFTLREKLHPGFDSPLSSDKCVFCVTFSNWCAKHFSKHE